MRIEDTRTGVHMGVHESPLPLESTSITVPSRLAGQNVSCPKRGASSHGRASEQTLNASLTSASSSQQQERWQDAMPNPDLLLVVAAGRATPLLPDLQDASAPAGQILQDRQGGNSSQLMRDCSWLAVNDAMPDPKVTDAIPNVFSLRQRSAVGRCSLGSGGLSRQASRIAEKAEAVRPEAHGTSNPHYSSPLSPDSDDLSEGSRGCGRSDGGQVNLTKPTALLGYFSSGCQGIQSKEAPRKNGGGKGLRGTFLDWLSTLTGRRSKDSRQSLSFGGNAMTHTAAEIDAKRIGRRLSMQIGGLDAPSEIGSLPRILSSKEVIMLRKRRSSKSMAYVGETSGHPVDAMLISTCSSSHLLVVPALNQPDTEIVSATHSPQRNSLDLPCISGSLATLRNNISGTPLSSSWSSPASSSSPPVVISTSNRSLIVEAVLSPKRHQHVSTTVPDSRATLNSNSCLQEEISLLSSPRMRSLMVSRSRTREPQQHPMMLHPPPMIDATLPQGHQDDVQQAPPALPGSIE